MQTRYLEPFISSDALQSHKMAFISGPRQVGKTFLARSLLESQENYFNWDDINFARAWVKNPLDALGALGKGAVALDEIHKYPRWKSLLKGVYDQRGQDLPLIVTGSARLDVYQKGGDSLMGRYLPYRLHPFSVAERTQDYPKPEWWSNYPVIFPLEDLLRCSGFPEPLLAGSQAKAERWSRLRLERLVREEIRDFKNIRDLESMKLLVNLLPEKVGSPLSLNNLREDLQTAYGTVIDWMSLLEHLYVCFKVPPYSKKISRSLRKESKYYLYDWLPIQDEGARLENLVALHLLKLCHFWTDTAQGFFELRYMRTKDGAEVDFCLLQSGEPWALIECKSKAQGPHPHLVKMAKLFPKSQAFQLTLEKTDKVFPDSKIRLLSVEKFLSGGI